MVNIGYFGTDKQSQTLQEDEAEADVWSIYSLAYVDMQLLQRRLLASYPIVNIKLD